MERHDLELKPTIGVCGGLTIQFAEGRWTGRHEFEIGEGLALTEEAFDLIEHCLRTVCPEWTPMHRYGVFELPDQTRLSLSTLLRSEAAHVEEGSNGAGSKSEMFGRLADWLDGRSAETPISILGI